MNQTKFVPRAPSPRRRSVGPSRLIQVVVKGAKSLDATPRWCRPPSMAGEQGWSGAAMRANLDVKRETQRASAGAHRVARFESPSCLLHPGARPAVLAHLGPCRGADTNTHCKPQTHRHTHRERDRGKRGRDQQRSQSGAQRAGQRGKAAGGRGTSGLSHATKLRALRISRNTIQHSESDMPTLVISRGNQKSAHVPEPTTGQEPYQYRTVAPAGPELDVSKFSRAGRPREIRPMAQQIDPHAQQRPCPCPRPRPRPWR